MMKRKASANMTHRRGASPRKVQRKLWAERTSNRAKNARSALAQRLLSKVVTEYGIVPGQRIAAAVSGGADSVALLRLLLELRESWGVVLSVVHFNHELRGKASDGDEKFVAGLALQFDLPIFVSRENVGASAKQQKANLEETARRMRYAFFERLAAEGKVDRVAVAHSADDQAETVLSHLLRGTGLAGLGGIHPEAGVVFRPLLKVRRAELRTYLRALGQSWREDATNRDVTRTRARIRRKLIPFLEKEFQPAVVEHLCQLAELAREEDAWLESSAELRVFLNAKEEKDGWRVPVRELVGAPEKGDEFCEWTEQNKKRHGFLPSSGQAEVPRLPKAESAGIKASATKVANAQALAGQVRVPVPRAVEAMSKRMIRLVVKEVKPRAGQLSAVHVQAVLRLAQQSYSGKTVQLPGGVEVRRERDSLLFRPLRAEAREGLRTFRHQVDLSKAEGELRDLEHSLALRFQVIDWPPEGRETKGTGAVLDRDKLCFPLVVRNWQPGDAVQALGHQKRHKLSRLLNELGISRWEKESWPVLTCGGRIAWCRGLPVAVEFAAGESTRTGVVITEVPLA
jgi:tRNA(Ile)-lysidine synthetase-like protein